MLIYSIKKIAKNVNIVIIVFDIKKNVDINANIVINIIFANSFVVILTNSFNINVSKNVNMTISFNIIWLNNINMTNVHRIQYLTKLISN